MAGNPASVEPPFPIEWIPGSDRVYYRIHVSLVPHGRLQPNVFRASPIDGAMSVDWEKYSTARETRQRGQKPAREYGIVALPVQGIRAIEGTTVTHDPLPENRAHTAIRGLSDPVDKVRVRKQLYSLVAPDNWEIHFSVPAEGSG